MRIDPAAVPFVLLAAVPAAIATVLAPVPLTLVLALLPIGVTVFFRDPDRRPPPEHRLVLAPADGRVTHAGPARADEAPPGTWLQVTIFLSLLDVHINRTPVSGRVLRVDYVPGTFLAAFRPEAHGNERSEIWVDSHGTMVVFRQVVGLLARRVLCRVGAGDDLAAGQRIGLMKFGSRMDVFVPTSATVTVKAGDRTRAGETVIAQLAPGTAS